MKTWWLNLSLREKQTVVMGAALASLFLIYECVFAALADKVSALRQQIHSNQRLLSWMQQSDRRIQQLEKNQNPSIAKNSASLLGSVQNDINKSAIAKNVSQLQQAENDSVQLHLQKVSFDRLTAWLIAVCQQQQLTITQMTVTPSATAGVVDADLKLQAG